MSKESVTTSSLTWLVEYKCFHKEIVTPFLNELISAGGEIEQQSYLVQSAFNEHQKFLVYASQRNKPNKDDQQAVIRPLLDSVFAIQDYQEKHRGSDQFKVLTAISNGAPFLAWVAYQTNPAFHVQLMAESAQFYTDQIMRNEENSTTNVRYCMKLWIDLLISFQEYVNQYHPSGLRWNTGERMEKSIFSSEVSGKHSYALHSDDEDEDVIQFSKVVAEIEKESLKERLKKVTPEMQTHKNPSLRKPGPVEMDESKTVPKTKRKDKTEPVLDLRNKRWIVENHSDNLDLRIDETNEKQLVYMYNCRKTFLTIKGKIKSLCVDKCEGCVVVFDNLITACAFVNCNGIKAECTGFVPSIIIEKTDCLDMYLEEETLLNCEIRTGKTSQINICVLRNAKEVLERQIKDQFKTIWNGERLITTPYD